MNHMLTGETFDQFVSRIEKQCGEVGVCEIHSMEGELTKLSTGIKICTTCVDDIKNGWMTASDMVNLGFEKEVAEGIIKEVKEVH